MALVLHAHPMSSYCWKALIALYETGEPFRQVLIDFGNPDSVAAFKALWPIAKMPVLHDLARGEVVAEATIVVEYLAQHYPGDAALLPADEDEARAVRFWDRVFDNYLQTPMQKVVGDRLRQPDDRDLFGVRQAHADLETAYGLIDGHMAGRQWVVGESFTLADCAAAPGLFYADKIVPLGDHPHAAAYLERLKARPSFARVLREAGPYLGLFPK